jgi:hypothetical protein
MRNNSADPCTPGVTGTPGDVPASTTPGPSARSTQASTEVPSDTCHRLYVDMSTVHVYVVHMSVIIADW